MKFQFNLVWLSILFSIGCFHNARDQEPKSTAVLSHLVFCWLKEPGNLEHRDAIIKMTESFREIPTVLDARAGRPIMSERAIVDDSFDVGIIVEVKDEADLQAYLDHPIHQKAKKEVLLPLVDRVLVYDFAK